MNRDLARAPAFYSGIRYQVPGSRCRVPGTWDLVPGT